MFSKPVREVSSTRIFARAGAGDRQYLVYSMSIEATEAVAMILPIPVRPGSGEKAVRFRNLEKYPEFFTHLESLFAEPVKEPPASALRPALANAALEVVSVGSYEASYVPTLADFERLDDRFKFPKQTWDKLPVYKDHGFAVFKLKKGRSQVHPMAFFFPRKNPRELFFPTVHVHDGQVHAEAQFDHDLFCQRSAEFPWDVEGWIESRSNAGSILPPEKTLGLVDGEQHCYRRRVEGMRRNEDIILRAH